MKYQTEIQQAIKNALEQLYLPLVAFSVAQSPQPHFGDFSTNVSLILGKEIGSNPMEIAEKISKTLNHNKNSTIEKIEVVKPGFINFFLSKEVLKSVVIEAIEKGQSYCSNFTQDTRLHIVEFSSPNIAKPFTIGHLRSTIIGDSIARLLTHAGYKVIKDNHLGDWGTQFGKMIYAIKEWGNEDALDKSTEPVKDLVVLYQRFNEEAEKNKALNDEARAWFAKLEKHDVEAKRIWKKCVDLSMIEFGKIYTRLNVTFDTYWGESHFEEAMIQVLTDLKSKNLLTQSEGAQVVFFDEKLNLPLLMILKKDGATLYATRDLATALYRKNFYGPDVVVINETGKEQSGYFKQIFELEEMLGYFKKEQRHHVAHGHYRFAGGKMSTRKGDVIWLEDVLNEAVMNAKKFSESKGSSTDAEKIGIGAIKWNDLSRSSEQDIIFDWTKILNMKGDSGPYLQYTVVRLRSLIQKANQYSPQSLESFKLDTNEWSAADYAMAKEIHAFSYALSRSVSDYATHYLASYLIGLARMYNGYYNANSVIENKMVSATPFYIAKAVENVLSIGLNLFGIEIPEKM